MAMLEYRMELRFSARRSLKTIYIYYNSRWFMNMHPGQFNASLKLLAQRSVQVHSSDLTLLLHSCDKWSYMGETVTCVLVDGFRCECEWSFSGFPLTPGRWPATGFGLECSDGWCLLAVFMLVLCCLLFLPWTHVHQAGLAVRSSLLVAYAFKGDCASNRRCAYEG